MIYIHIGTSKTGTTSLQRALVDNRDLLLKKNILYPEETIQHWGHHNLYYELSQKKLFDTKYGTFDELLLKLMKYKDSPSKSVIISSETFCGALPHELSHMITHLKEIDDVKIVVYYRRQDQYLRSFWSMYVSQGLIETRFEKWARSCIANNKYSLYYDRQVKKIEKLIGRENILLSAYDDIPKSDFFKYFLGVCGLEDMSGIEEPTVSYNKSKLPDIFNENQAIIDICKTEYAASNRILARRYLKREELFRFPN